MEHTSASFDTPTFPNADPPVVPPKPAPAAASEAEALRRANEKLQAELEQLRADLASQRDALQAEREAVKGQQQSSSQEVIQPSVLSADDNDAPESDAYPAATFRPSSFEQDDDTQEEDVPPARLSREIASAQTERRAPAAGPGHEDEESIESYMAALLTRMRGGESASVVAVEPPRPRQRKSDPAPQQDQPKAEPVTAEPASQEPALVVAPPPPRKLVPRPKMEARDLAAMRELANAQARMAIHTHGRKQLVKILLIRSVAAAGCLAASFAALRIWPFEHEILFGCGMAGIVAGIYWMSLAATDAQKFLTWFESRDKESPSDAAQAKSAET